LLGPFTRFQPRDTIEWFERRGVKLKTEDDGRVFPVTDSSQTIADCLLQAAEDAHIAARAGCAVRRIWRENAGFKLLLSGGEELACDRVLIATGGCRTLRACETASALGHAIEPPVPSLFTLHTDGHWLNALAGISVDVVGLSAPGTNLRTQGAILMTHNGLSGPAVLALSAWGARALHGRAYRFPLQINWLPQFETQAVMERLAGQRRETPARLVRNAPMAPLPARLWEQMVRNAGIIETTRWSGLGRQAQHALLEGIIRTEVQIAGKSLNKEEFVTCGGVRLSEVDFRTMESRLCPGLYFAGEVLDIDGLTGGFNFQAAWTTGWIAGTAIGARR
jgi:predicted Rossmann fold flavoprotein